MPISPNPPDTTAPSARSGLPIETHTDHHEVARSPGSPPLQPPRCSNRAPHIRHLAWGLLGLAIALALSRLDWNALAQPLFNVALALEAPYTAWLDARLTGGFPPWGLPLLSFLGGLAASFSPCVLGLLPVNLSYIGTQQVRSRRAATIRASGFVLGVATTYSLLGLFSALAGAILIAYRGYVSLGVGLLIGVMVLSLLGWIRLPLPQPPPTLAIAGPYGIGLTFALVSSPCSSPILFAILGAAAATGSHSLAALTMFSFALGYSALIFVASLFAGCAQQTRRLQAHSALIQRGAIGMLSILGLYYAIDGLSWILATT